MLTSTDRCNSKNSRKKCSEGRPKCDRCEVRNLPCEYILTNQTSIQTHRSTGTDLASNHQSALEHQQVTSQWNSEGNDAVDVSLASDGSFNGILPSISPSTFPDSFWNPGSIVDFDLDGFDLEGPLRFIESAFPTVYASPASATSSFRPRTASLQEAPSANDIESFGSTEPAFDPAITLKDRERTYFYHFLTNFYETIIRKEEEQKALDMHFAQLAGFRPLMYAILAVGAAHQAQLDRQASTFQTITDEALKFHSKAVKGLKISIDNKTKCPRNAIIACTFCLLFYEMIRGGFSTAPTHHLLGALHLMKTDANAGLNRTSMFHHKARAPDSSFAMCWAELIHAAVVPLL